MTVLFIFILVLLVLALTRVPFAFATAGATLVGFLYVGLKVTALPSSMVTGLDSFILLAIPCFILSGQMMAKSGIAATLVSWIKAWVGRIRGYLGAVTCITSAFFGAITGSSVATVAAIGGIMAPEMEKDGYSKEYTTAFIAVCGLLGTLIPPSIPALTYSLMADTNVMEMWMSTLSAGIMMVIGYVAINFFVFGRKQSKSEKNTSVKEYFSNIAVSTPKALIALIMPIIIFGGVYGGVFTATEAGTVSVFYALIAGWALFPIFYRMKPTNLWWCLKGSMVSAVAIGLLLAVAAGTGHLISLAGVADAVQEFVLANVNSRFGFLLLVNLVMLICGMLLECNVGIILLTPIFLPTAQAYGITPEHFGAIMLLNLEIGLITPPHAGNIFVACGVTGSTMDKVIKPMLPYYLWAMVVLATVTYWPQFSMFFVELICR